MFDHLVTKTKSILEHQSMDDSDFLNDEDYIVSNNHDKLDMQSIA